MMEFELLENNLSPGIYHMLYRAKIPGGWLVLGAYGVCFVPDPEHNWDGRSLPKGQKESREA